MLHTNNTTLFQIQTAEFSTPHRKQNPTAEFTAPRKQQNSMLHTNKRNQWAKQTGKFSTPAGIWKRNRQRQRTKTNQKTLFASKELAFAISAVHLSISIPIRLFPGHKKRRGRCFTCLEHTYHQLRSNNLKNPDIH